MNIHYLELAFENCESIVLPIERIIQMKTKNETPFLDDENTYRCDFFYLSFTYKEESELNYDPEAYDEPLGMFRDNPMSNYVTDRPNIIGRILNHTDLVDIYLLDEEEKQLRNIYVPWHEDDEYSNRWMKTNCKNGVFEIIIKEEEKEKRKEQKMKDWSSILKENTDISAIEHLEKFKIFLQKGEFEKEGGTTIKAMEISDAHEIWFYRDRRYIQSYALHNWQEWNQKRLKIITGEFPNPNETLSARLKQFFSEGIK